MPPPSLSTLAPELILTIYEVLEEPSSITALNSSSRNLYLNWKLHAAKISQAVLSRSLPSYSNAIALVEVQERYQPKSKDEMNAYDAVLARNKALVSNAAKVALAEKLVRIGIATMASRNARFGGIHEVILTPDLRLIEKNPQFYMEVNAPFIPNYYLLWQITVLVQDEEAFISFLAELDFADLWAIKLVDKYFNPSLDWESRVRLGMISVLQVKPVSPDFTVDNITSGRFGWGVVSWFVSNELWRRGGMSKEAVESTLDEWYLDFDRDIVLQYGTRRIDLLFGLVAD